MDHRQYIEHYLSADIDGELNPAERQAVSSHLAGCADCRQRQADERAFKTLLRQRLGVVSAPPELRHKIIDALDREDAARIPRRARFSRRPLWLGSLGAVAAAAVILVIILVGGLRRQGGGGALDTAANDYLNAERTFNANPAIGTPTDLASTLMTEFGYPFVWDFSPLGMTLAGVRVEHRPDGGSVVYSLYKGKGQSILCINLRQANLSFPPGGKEVHGVHFYQHGDLWIGVVNYGSVFCYFVTRMSPTEMLPALVHNKGPNLGA